MPSPTSLPASAAAPGGVPRAALWMTGALVSFSVMAVAAREAMRGIGPLELMLWRAAIGLALLVALCAALPGRANALRSAQPALQAGRAVLHFGAQYAWIAALTMIPLVEVFALEFTAPLWVALLAPLFLGERLTAARAAAAALGFAGALVVIWPPDAGPSLASFASHLSLGAGSLLALASAVGFAFNMMAVRRLMRTDRPLTLLLWMHAVQLPIAAALVFAGPGVALSSASTLGWAVLCALCGLGAHYSLSRASRLADAIVVAPMDFLRLPLIAVVGVALYAEPLRTAVLAGAACILVANGLNLWFEPRAPRR